MSLETTLTKRYVSVRELRRTVVNIMLKGGYRTEEQAKIIIIEWPKHELIKYICSMT